MMVVLGPISIPGRFIYDFFHVFILPGFLVLLIAVILLIWAERKIAGLVQLRYGPLYVSRRIGGALQLVADLIRYSFQEFIIPERADRIPFLTAPALALLFAIVPIAFIPIAPGIAPPINTSSNLLIVLAVLAVAPIYVVLAGIASDNKFSFIGSLREVFLIISYEIPFFISILSIAMIFRTLDLSELVYLQSSFLWGALLNPVAAIVAYIAILRITSRFPFEISEAESEIVMGPYTEYSGLMYGVSMGISYIKLYIYSLLYTIVFLGGWLPFQGGMGFVGDYIIGNLVIIAKASILMLISVFLRAVYPRYRVDQAIRLGWSTVFILSIVSLIWSLVVSYLVGRWL
ncbi:MAG: NADH-quinone oxidoreductase subunit NuoH [Sulfolobales archaeon]